MITKRIVGEDTNATRESRRGNSRDQTRDYTIRAATRAAHLAIGWMSVVASERVTESSILIYQAISPVVFKDGRYASFE